MSLVLLGALAPAALLSLGWLLALVGRPAALAWRRCDTALLLAAAAVVVALAVGGQTGGLRVLSDEAGFLTTARALRHTGLANGEIDWVQTAEGLRPLHAFPIFRPALFPALIALAGVFTGESWRTGIALNLLFFALLLFLVARWAEKGQGWPAALAAVALLAFQPELRAIAFSGGYDLLALLLFLTSLASWRAFAQARAERAFTIALVAALAFAHVRYEGLLWLGCLFGGRWLFRLGLPGRGVVAAVLLLAVPLVLQRLAFPAHVDVPAGVPLFSAGRIPAQGAELLRSWLSPGSRGPLLCGLLTALASLRRFRAARDGVPAAFLAAYLVFLLGFHGGSANDPYQSRLFLPFTTLLLLAAAWSAGTGSRLRRWPIGVGLSALAFFQPGDALLWRHPMTGEMAVLATRVLASPEKTLFIYPFPSHIAALGRASLQPWRYLRDPAWAEAQGHPVVWIERYPAIEKAPLRPDWADAAHLRSTDALPGAFRSLEFYERSP